MKELWKSIKIPSYTTSKEHFRRHFLKIQGYCRCWINQFQNCMNDLDLIKKKFNFKDGGYPYDTKCVSDHIDDKYNKKNCPKKIKISVPNSSMGGGLRVRDNVPKIEYFFFKVFPSYVVHLIQCNLGNQSSYGKQI